MYSSYFSCIQCDKPTTGDHEGYNRLYCQEHWEAKEKIAQDRLNSFKQDISPVIGFKYLLDAENHPRTLLIWKFEEAPEIFRKMSDNGGDEDWIALVPQLRMDSVILVG